MERPTHISPHDWQAMSWHARQRARRRAGLTLVPALTEPPMPRTPTLQRPKVRIYRLEPGCWEITNGISTARTATAEAAWRLIQLLDAAS